ncbi:MAG TPA: N-acetyltransferase [Actinomycetota bacterium]
MGADASRIELAELNPERRRSCIALEVTPEQVRFVAPIPHYLGLCEESGSPWRPLAVLCDGSVVGFVMHGVDPADDSAWIGGLVVDRASQRRGIGRAVIDLLVARATAQGRSSALSYEPANVVAKALYAKAGFSETGEVDGDEVVARRPL